MSHGTDAFPQSQLFLVSTNLSLLIICLMADVNRGMEIMCSNTFFIKVIVFQARSSCEIVKGLVQ